MTVPFERLESDRSAAATADCRDGSRCEDCRRAVALARLVEFAAETRRAEVERASRELAGSSPERAEYERVLERIATGITQRLLVQHAVAFCHREDVDGEAIDAMLELFELEVETP